MSKENHSVSVGTHPEFTCLPRKGKGRCPHTGLSLTMLRRLESAGLIRLIRIVLPGYKRGTVMVPVWEVLDFMRGQRGKVAPAIAGQNIDGPQTFGGAAK